MATSHRVKAGHGSLRRTALRPSLSYANGPLGSRHRATLIAADRLGYIRAVAAEMPHATTVAIRTPGVRGGRFTLAEQQVM